MTPNDVIAHGLRQSFEMLKMTLADMSDAELMQRPVPAANHPNWQLGHLVVSEVHMLSQAGAAMPELPAGFAERYTKETCKVDDPKQFATKADLLASYEKVRAASIAWVNTLTLTQLEAPSPMPQWFPTLADFLALGIGHIAMHQGQIQVLRRKLGKPILF